MTIAAWIGQTRVRLGDRDLLGVGGEANVYGYRDRAVKIYHPAPAGDAAARARVELALAKVVAFPRALPDAVVAPLDVVTDDAGAALGYAMRRVGGAAEVARLGRAGAMTSADASSLFARIHDVVSALHARAVVLGDFNDANVLFRRGSPFFIDADSMQFGGYPCVVAHERYLDPALYGKDLAAAPAFSSATDWYAFAVMLFTSLLHVHPYGGTHRALPTMLRRAEARHSVLRPDVAYPRAATPFAVLSDDLLARFSAVFDGGDRAPFPATLLAARWTRCACGVEHARRACPSCAKAARGQVAADVTPGGCACAIVARTRGRLLAAAVQGALLWAAEEDGSIVREDGSRVACALPDDARVALSGSATYVSRGERLSRAARGVVEDVTSTSAFDAGAAGAFAVVDGWIMDLARGTRVGQVLEGQTFLRVGARMGIGFYRTGSITEVFVFRTDRGGVARAAIQGDGAVRARDRVASASACFDGDAALLTLVLDRDGRRLHALHLLRADGAVIASACGAPDASPLLAAPTGRCLLRGMVLCPTDDGLLLARGLSPEKTFPGTRRFVDAASELLPGPGGSVYVVGPKEIAHLSMG
jgi:hypothetical protein